MGSLNTLLNSGLALILNFLALIVLTAALTIFAVRTSRQAFLSFIIALYVGYALYLVFPFELVGKTQSSTTASIVHIALYLILSLLTYLLLRRIGGASQSHIHILPVVFIAFLTSGFLLALGYHAFGIQHILTLSRSLTQFFAPANYFFYWFIAPLIALFIFAR